MSVPARGRWSSWLPPASTHTTPTGAWTRRTRCWGSARPTRGSVNPSWPWLTIVRRSVSTTRCVPSRGGRTPTSRSLRRAAGSDIRSSRERSIGGVGPRAATTASRPRTRGTGWPRWRSPSVNQPPPTTISSRRSPHWHRLSAGGRARPQRACQALLRPRGLADSIRPLPSGRRGL